MVQTTGTTSLLTPASDQRDDRVNRIIEEGHVQRLHEAASRWNLEVRKSLADDNAKGVGVPETRFHWQFSPDAMCKDDALRRTFDELRRAAAALKTLDRVVNACTADEPERAPETEPMNGPHATTSAARRTLLRSA